MVITIGFKPGVTDNPGKAALDGFRTISQMQVTIPRYPLTLPMSSKMTPGLEIEWLAKQLHNGLIERALYSVKGEDFPTIEYAPVTPSNYAPQLQLT